MGKGDKKTKRGKIFAGSSGNTRLKSKKKLGLKNQGQLTTVKIEKDVKPKVVREKKVKVDKDKVSKRTKANSENLDKENN